MIDKIALFSVTLGVLFLVQVLIVTTTMREKYNGDGAAMFFYVLTSLLSLFGYIGIYVNLAWLSPLN